MRSIPVSSVHSQFVAMLYVSEIPIQKLHKIIPKFEKRLLANEYGIYSTDNTRNFSRTLDSKNLEDYLDIDYLYYVKTHCLKSSCC